MALHNNVWLGVTGKYSSPSIGNIVVHKSCPCKISEYACLGWWLQHKHHHHDDRTFNQCGSIGLQYTGKFVYKTSGYPARLLRTSEMIVACTQKDSKIGICKCWKKCGEWKCWDYVM
jgi:hypothetical protein